MKTYAGVSSAHVNPRPSERPVIISDRPLWPVQASGNDTGDNVPASPQCRALISSAIEDSSERERLDKEEYYRKLPNLWDPEQAAAVLEAEKPKEVISRADNTIADFPPGSEGMLGRVYTEVCCCLASSPNTTWLHVASNSWLRVKLQWPVRREVSVLLCEILQEHVALAFHTEHPVLDPP